MDKGIRLGKVVGFPLSIDWSVLVIMWLFTWSLAATLPDTAPGHSSTGWPEPVVPRCSLRRYWPTS